MTKRDPAAALYEFRRLSVRVSRGFGWFLIVGGVLLPLANRYTAIQKPDLAEIIARENAHTDPTMLGGIAMGILLLVLIPQANALFEHDRGHTVSASELRGRARFARIVGWMLLVGGMGIALGSRVIASLRPEMADVVARVNAWTDPAAFCGAALSLTYINISRLLRRRADAAEKEQP